MSRLAKLAQRIVAPRDIPVPTGSGAFWDDRGWRQPLFGERDYMRDVGDGSDNNAIQAIFNFIVNQMMEAPVQVLNKADRSAIPDHPMTEKISRPNPYYSGTLLWSGTRRDWLADGNGYWLIIPDAAGGDAEYWWAPHWTMEPKGSADGKVFIEYYEYRPGGANSMIKLDPSLVVHFRWGLDPQNPRKGFSPLKGLLREVFTDEEAARFTSGLLRNAGAPGLVLAPTGDASLTPAEATDVKADLIAKTTGDHRGEPLVMYTPTQISTYGFSPQQMDLSSIRAVSESRFASAYGIPAAVIGFLTGMKQTAVGATLNELRQLAYESGIAPKLVLFADELGTQLLPHYTSTPENFIVTHDLSRVRVLQEDENARSTRLLAQYAGSAISVEEIRADLGRDPEFTPGDHVIVASSVDVIPVDQLDAIQPSQPQLLQPPPRIAAKRTMLARPSLQQVAFLREIDRAHQRNMTAFTDDLHRAFDDLGGMAEAAIDRAGVRLSLEGDAATVALILAQMGLDAWTIAELVPLFGRQYQRMASSTYQAMGNTFELGVGTDLPDPVAREVIAIGGKRVGLIDLTAQTRQALFDALAQAREEGLGPVESSRLIRQYVGAGRYTEMERAKAGAGVRFRAETIARTETLYAQNVSVLEAGRAAGFTKYLAFDNRTGFDDADCMSRDGTEFDEAGMIAERDSEHPRGTLSFSPVPGSQVAA